MFSKSRVPRFGEAMPPASDHSKINEKASRKSKTLPYVVSASMIPRPKNAKKSVSGMIDGQAATANKSEEDTNHQKPTTSNNTEVILNPKMYNSYTSGEVGSVSRESDKTAHREKSAPASFRKLKLKVEAKKAKSGQSPGKATSKGPSKDDMKSTTSVENVERTSSLDCVIAAVNDIKGNILNFTPKLLADLELELTDLRDSVENSLVQIPKVFVKVTKNILKIRYDFFSERPSSTEARHEWFEDETKNIKLVIEETREEVKDMVDSVCGDIKKLFSTRESLRQELKSILETSGKATWVLDKISELKKQLTNTMENLRSEQNRNNDLAQDKNQQEVAYKKKIHELETKINELSVQLKVVKTQRDENSTRMLQNTKFKDLKDLKQKTELLKFLESRITELTSEHNNQKKSMEKQIFELEKTLDEKTKILQHEMESAGELKKALEESERALEKVRTEKKALSALVDKSKAYLQPPKTYHPSTREKELWTELEATKVIAKEYQEQTEKLKIEKEQQINEFQRISEGFSKGQTERLAAESVRKDDIIKSLKEEVTKLQKKCEEHSIKYNALRNHIKDMKDKFQSGKSDQGPLCNQIADLKMQVSFLESHISELMNHNEHLESTLAQRSLELEQRDQLFKQQSKIINVRDNLMDLLKKKDAHSKNDENKIMRGIWEKGSEKISKNLENEAHNLDELYKVLHDKQNQINKLHDMLQHKSPERLQESQPQAQQQQQGQQQQPQASQQQAQQSQQQSQSQQPQQPQQAVPGCK